MGFKSVKFDTILPLARRGGGVDEDFPTYKKKVHCRNGGTKRRRNFAELFYSSLDENSKRHKNICV